MTGFTFVQNATNQLAPSLWRCYGSLDGINWVEIIDASNQFTTATYSGSYVANSTNIYCTKTLANLPPPYLYIGWVVKQLNAGTTGSFYLSLNGAHRLIDTKETIVAKTDSSIQKQTDSIAKYYNNEIQFYRNQPARNRADRKYRDSIVAELQKSKDTKISAIESKITEKTNTKLDEVKENGFAFAAMVFFLEFIILIGVAFNAYYVWTSYVEMKKVMLTPKYKYLDVNLSLLKLYYQNGKKKNQEPVIPRTKITTLAKAAKLSVTQADIDGFVVLCEELGVTAGERQGKVYNMEYDEAKNLIENN